MPQVGGVRTGALRRTHAEEVDVGKGRSLGGVGREAQPAGLDMGTQQRLQAWLEERQPAGGQRGDLLGVDVEAEDLVAELGHAGGVGGAEVAGADHRHPQGPDRRGRQFVHGHGGLRGGSERT